MQKLKQTKQTEWFERMACARVSINIIKTLFGCEYVSTGSPSTSESARMWHTHGEITTNDFVTDPIRDIPFIASIYLVWVQFSHVQPIFPSFTVFQSASTPFSTRLLFVMRAFCESSTFFVHLAATGAPTNLFCVLRKYSKPTLRRHSKLWVNLFFFVINEICVCMLLLHMRSMIPITISLYI